MTCISEIVKIAASKSIAESSGCTAIVSIAERAARYEPIMRKSQLSKVCLYHENITSTPTKPAIQKHQVYIVC